MNERIKALMGQTLDEKFAGTWSTMDMQDLTKFAEKFAELIVRECASVGYDASYYECALNVSNKIKQHFGVEE
jgi:hypothetical protein